MTRTPACLCQNRRACRVQPHLSQPWNMASTVKGFRSQKMGSSIIILTLAQQASGQCGSDNSSEGKPSKRQDSGTCWYQLWYFWLIIMLLLFTAIVLIVVYCKVKVKQHSRHRGVRSDLSTTPVLTMPVAPPLYEAPGHDPPAYDLAMATSVEAHSVTVHLPPSQGDVPRRFRGHSHGSRPQVEIEGVCLPGSVSEHDRQCSPALYDDNVSTVSTISGTFSSPPPYSPPHSAYLTERQHLSLVYERVRFISEVLRT